MKGFVLHFGRKSKTVRLPGSRGVLSIHTLVSHYGLPAFFVTLFVMGLAVGAVCSRSMSSAAADRLDFLFVTNLAARVEMTGFGIFLSCFVPYFLFVFADFLCAFSAWGFVMIPLLPAFRGFSTGLSSAMVFSSFGMSGIGFFILIVLPGTVLFLFGFIRYSRECFRLSARYARLTVFGTEQTPLLGVEIKSFLKKSIFAFLLSCACSVSDMLLWVLFAEKFHF